MLNCATTVVENREVRLPLMTDIFMKSPFLLTTLELIVHLKVIALYTSVALFEMVKYQVKYLDQ